MRVISRAIIYENPLPQLRSRHAFFPGTCVLGDGAILAASVIGEALESVDSATRLFISRDGARSFSEYHPSPICSRFPGKPVSSYAKPTALGGGKLVLFGYAMLREDPELPLCNPATGGILPSAVFFCCSDDWGCTWGEPREVPCRWGRHVEASAPLLVLPGGDWVTPIAGFPDWDGALAGRHGGRLLRSRDNGSSWDDETVTMAFEQDSVACYEQRLCRLEASGNLVCIAWNQDLRTDTPLPNHFTISADGGRTFSKPRPTGVRGQSSSVCPIGSDRLLALHAVRRDTERPGIYAYTVNLQHGEWDIESELLVWEPPTPVMRNRGMPDVFAYLQFGQPGAVRLNSDEVLMTHWYIENGQGRTMCTRIAL
jgi:hypothetical protein